MRKQDVEIHCSDPPAALQDLPRCRLHVGAQKQNKREREREREYSIMVGSDGLVWHLRLTLVQLYTNLSLFPFAKRPTIKWNMTSLFLAHLHTHALKK